MKAVDILTGDSLNKNRGKPHLQSLLRDLVSGSWKHKVDVLRSPISDWLNRVIILYTCLLFLFLKNILIRIDETLTYNI